MIWVNLKWSQTTLCHCNILYHWSTFPKLNSHCLTFIGLMSETIIYYFNVFYEWDGPLNIMNNLNSSAFSVSIFVFVLLTYRMAYNSVVNTKIELLFDWLEQQCIDWFLQVGLFISVADRVLIGPIFIMCWKLK